MIRDGVRVCDVCEGEIPKGETYRITRLLPEQAQLFLDTQIQDVDMLPTWTQEENGKVRLDICLECHISMGNELKSDISH